MNKYSLPWSTLLEQNDQNIQQKGQAKTLRARTTSFEANFSTSRRDKRQILA